MKSKFHVGQIVTYKGDPYRISSRFYEDYGEGKELFFMLELQKDNGFGMASPEHLRKLTKKERG